MKGFLSLILGVLGYEVRAISHEPALEPAPINDAEFKSCYELARRRTLVSEDRCYVLYRLLHQSLKVEGDVWECGVFKGGTAALLASVLAGKAPSRKLYLFDTFEGMPEVDAARDQHSKGDFSDTSEESVERFLGRGDFCITRKGFIPATFSGLESARIAFGHIDVDLYQSVKACLEFIWPRLSAGGWVVCDDYGFPTCPGAKQAVDEFFAGKPAFPLSLRTGQAVIFKSEA